MCRLGHGAFEGPADPRLLDQVKQYLSEVDPIFTETATEENAETLTLFKTPSLSKFPRVQN